jgi:hypothetical protein
MIPEVYIPPLDPQKWPGLIKFIVDKQSDEREFSPYTEAEIRDIMKPVKRG